MVLLRIPPLRRRHNLGRHGLLVPLLADLLRHVLGDLLLLVTMREDDAAVLRANIGALAVHGRRVVHAVEEFEKGPVGNDGGVKRDIKGLGI